MDLLDRLLGHDAWTTQRLLALAAGLDDASLDLDFDIGHRSVRATLLHLVRNVEVWSDLMAGAPVRPKPGPSPDERTVAGLIVRHQLAADNFAVLARTVAARGGWDERWLDTLDDPPAEKSFGGGIAHLITHSHHHRAQLIHMLHRLGVKDVPEGDVLGWEQRAVPAPPPATKVAEPDPGPGIVTLREVEESTVRAICRLAVRPEQQMFVAPNAVSLAQAHFSKHAWFRAIYADDTPVGFIMLSDEPEKPEYSLWRFMIDAHHQRAGHGRRAMEQVIAHVRTRPGAVELLTSVVPGPGNPQPFSEGLGFQSTGRMEDGELVLRLGL